VSVSVSAGSLTKTATTKVTAYSGTTPSHTSTWAPLKHFAPGQFIESGSGYGWSLGAWGGYEVWKLAASKSKDWGVPAEDGQSVRYESFAGYYMPGISLTAGIRAKFDGKQWHKDLTLACPRDTRKTSSFSSCP
jgi:hypothetical protein